MPHKTYNTPKRKCVVKTRLTEDERRAFEDKCAALSMSQSEYIRQAVFYSRISPVIRVTAHSEEMLTAISSLVAQYGKIGSNLNQIARYLNEYGAPYNALSSEVRAAVSDLAALKFEVLKVIGEAYPKLSGIAWTMAKILKRQNEGNTYPLMSATRPRWPPSSFWQRPATRP